MNSNGNYVDSCSNFATSSCSNGMHVNAYQTPNCTELATAVQQNTNAANITNNIANNLLLKNSGIYANNYTTCTNLLNLRPGSNHNLVDDVYGNNYGNNYANNYLPSPYASTHIQLPTCLDETSLKLDHQQQQILIDKKSFSNIYDLPQQCANQTNQPKSNNPNRTNSISIVSF